MFGAYRVFLALLVVLNHLAGAHEIGRYAVFGFYILSGYLMTYIMQRNYGYSLAGVKRYFVNRFLRIYPMYWIACLISLVLIGMLGAAYTKHFDAGMYFPMHWRDMSKNVLIIFSNMSRPKLTPPAWALTVELFFYLGIGFGFSRYRKLTLLWFFGSLCYTLVVNILGWSWEYRYFTIYAGSLPFSTGALIFHYREWLTGLHSRYLGWPGMPVVYAVLVVANWAASYAWGLPDSWPFYANYLLCALMTLALMDKSLLIWAKPGLDKALGDLSYPIYLIHYQVGLAVMAIGDHLDIGLERPSLFLAVISIPVIILAAWLIATMIERPLELLRRKIGGQQR